MKIKKENKYFIFDRSQKIDIKYFLRLLKNFIRIFLYRINLYFTKTVEKPTIYNVAICAIFKNESKCLKEWIEFNHLIGVEHFYLYNNFSDDDYLKVLKPYIDKKLVTLIEWPYKQAQMRCYRDCIEKYKNETKWLGFIDLDELIIPNSYNNIYDLLKTKEHLPAILIYWKVFGSSGIYSRSNDSLMCEDFILSKNKYANIGKCFYNTKFQFLDDIEKINSSLHHKFYSIGRFGKLPPYNCFGKCCSYDFYNVVPIKQKNDKFPIQINHYYTKSLEEFIEKMSKGDVYFKENPHKLENFFSTDMNCQTIDYSAYKYLSKLKYILIFENNKEN